MFYIALVNAQPILGPNDCVQLDLVKRVCTLQPELMTKDVIRDNDYFKGLGIDIIICAWMRRIL